MVYNNAFRDEFEDKVAQQAIIDDLKVHMKEHDLKSKDMKKYIEYGWLYGICIVILMYTIVYRFFKCYRNNRSLVVFGGILVSGIITSMFEPGAIFGYLGGYSLWWLSYGIFSVQEPSFRKRN